MKTTHLVFSILILFISFFSNSSLAQVEHVNLQNIFLNSIECPKSALEGYNMFTDTTFTVLKPQYQQKLDFTKKYADSVKNYMMSLSGEMQQLISQNDPLMYDTSMNYVHRDLESQNQDMLYLVTSINEKILEIEGSFQQYMSLETDKSRKLQLLDEYMREKFSYLISIIGQKFIDKLFQINKVYQQVNYGESIRNPITRMPVMADLYATIVTFSDWKNQIVKNTALRLARDYYEYTH